MTSTTLHEPGDSQLVIHAPHLDESSRAALLVRLDVGSTRALLADDGPTLRVAARHDETGLPEIAREAGCDAAIVSRGASLDAFGLLAMDMDSTVITIECIDELAAEAGAKPRVAAITERAMRGEIDFAESLRQRVRLLDGLPCDRLQKVHDERLRFSSGAARLVQAARAAGLHTLLVSGGFTWFTERVSAALGIAEAHGNRLGVRGNALDGTLDGPILDAAGKAAAVRAAAARLGLRPDQVMVIGDGANDLAMMAEAGTSIAYHAKPVVRAKASLAIDHGGLDTVLSWFPPRPRSA